MYAMQAAVQSAIRLVFPPQCVSCGGATDSEFALCGGCWHGAQFIAGLVCDQCGVALPGEDPGEAVLCDDCLTIARPWSRGRAAMLYGPTGRRIALVAHAGTNSVTICHLLGLEPTPWEWERFVLHHASISRVEALPIGADYTFSLTRLSDVEHLAGPDRTR